jgi:hypothetical protein
MNMDLKCKTRKIRDQDKIKLLGDQVIKKGKWWKSSGLKCKIREMRGKNKIELLGNQVTIKKMINLWAINR